MSKMNVILDGLFRQNGTYDYDNDYEYKEEFEERGSEAVGIPVVFSLVLVVGLLGNVLVLVALVQKKQRWKMSDTFILHLGVADILLLMMLPFWALQKAQRCEWCCGFFCKTSAAVFKINFCCGIFLLVCISLDHFLSTTRGIQFYSHRMPSLAHASCFASWLLSLLFSIPDWIFIAHKEGTTECIRYYPESNTDWHLTSRLLHHILCFFIPTAALIMCWFYILQRHSSKEPIKQRRIMVILPLVVVFLLCWMPYNITLFVDTFHNHSKKKPSENPEGSLKAAHTVTWALGCLHACLRPLLYLLFSRNFRDQILSLLRCTGFESQGSLWELGVGEEAPRDQVQSEDELKQMTCGDDPVQSMQS